MVYVFMERAQWGYHSTVSLFYSEVALD